MNPWTCPKCGRVWSGMVTQCQPCNAKVTESERAKARGRGTTRDDMRRDTVRPGFRGPDCTCPEYGHGLHLTRAVSRSCPVHSEAADSQPIANTQPTERR